MFAATGFYLLQHEFEMRDSGCGRLQTSVLLTLNLLHDLTILSLRTSVVQDASEIILRTFGSLDKVGLDSSLNHPLTSVLPTCGLPNGSLATMSPPPHAMQGGLDASVLARLPGNTVEAQITNTMVAYSLYTYTIGYLE